MATVRYLGFLKDVKFLTTRILRGTNMRRHLVKFHADRLSRGGDITVFRFF